MSKNIILTGSEGFLGSEFKKYLLEKNNVFCIDIKKKKLPNYFPCNI